MKTKVILTPEERLRQVREAESRGDALDLLLFWGHTPPEDDSIGPHVLSQWWVAPFEVASIRYLTAEHFMMASKARLFEDDAACSRILAATTPKEAKRLGRGVQGFGEAAWERHRYELVVEGNLAKFSENAALRRFLVSTGERILVEASPLDRVWGIGLSRASPASVGPRSGRDSTSWASP